MADEACSKGKSAFINKSFLALVLVLVSAYQLGPDAWIIGKGLTKIVSCKLNPPNGHLKPLGQQVPPIQKPIKELHEWPTPAEFYNDILVPGQPVMFKGLAKFMPAFKKWNDDYLMQKYGHEEVAVEVGLKQKDYSDNLYLNVMKEFLNGYKEKDIYLVDTVSPARFEDVTLPRPLRCGNFQKSLSDVIMWLSAGNTKSIIHNDYVDNINCILDGTKTVHLFRKEYTDKHLEDFYRSVHVDPDRVDLCYFPAYAQLPRHEIHVEAGDCLFLPFQWFHYVTASNTRNLGVNFWFQHVSWFNESDCAGKNIDENYVYGAENISSAAILKQFELITFLRDERAIDMRKFVAAYNRGGISDEERLTKMFNEADTDGDGVVRPQDLYGMDNEKFLSFFNEFEGIRFLNYTRDRGNLDPVEINVTTNVEL